MELVKIRFDGHRYSWTVLDDGVPVTSIREWIIHLEEINQSPSTIQAYARHIARLGGYLKANFKSFKDITVADYDQFLQWLPYHLNGLPDTAANLRFLYTQIEPLSPTLKNQVQLATKSFYRYLSGNIAFHDTQSVISTRNEVLGSYKSFLEHINQRRSSRKKDRYLYGDINLAQKRITEKRLEPSVVLDLIKACHLLRDAFLITLLYNTGMRIGEVLGLRHTDINLSDELVWVVPRTNNENGARAKSRRSRAIPVMPYVLNMYEDYVTSDEYLNAFESGSQYVFCNIKRGRIGKALSKSYTENLKLYLRKRTGHLFTWHDFRHTHASEAIADGHSLLAVADRLGHASPQTTVDFYKHLFNKEVRKLHLTGPENLQKRLDEFSKMSTHLSEGAIKWI